MTRRYARLTTFGLVLSLMAASAAVAQHRGHGPRGGDSGLEHYGRLMERGRRATFAGKQKVQMGESSRPEGLVIVEQYQGCQRTEMVKPDRMKGMIVLERGSQRVVRRPSDGQWRSRPTAPSQSIWRLMRNYTVKETGQATIAGRSAIVVEVRGKAPGRPWRKLWLDAETGVPLRAESYTYRGDLAFVTEYQEIDFTPTIDPDDFVFPTLDPADQPQELTGEQAAAVPKPETLPVGFSPAGLPRQLKTPGGDAFHLRYGDGVAAVSMFVRKLKPGEDPNHAAGPAMEPFSRAVHAVKGNWRITVFGDIDPGELQRMADSVKPD